MTPPVPIQVAPPPAQQQQQQPAVDVSDGLLPGWEATTAPDGRTYYYHVETEVVQWTKPAIPVLNRDEPSFEEPPPPPDGFQGVFAPANERPKPAPFGTAQHASRSGGLVVDAQPPAKRLSGGFNNVWTKQAQGARNSWRTVDELVDTSTGGGGAAGAVEWFYLGAAREQQGPHTALHIHGLVRSGAVGGTSLAWKEGLAEWTPIAKIQELQPPAAAPAAAPPATASIAPLTRPRGNSRPPPHGIQAPTPGTYFPPPPAFKPKVTPAPVQPFTTKPNGKGAGYRIDHQRTQMNKSMNAAI